MNKIDPRVDSTTGAMKTSGSGMTGTTGATGTGMTGGTGMHSHSTYDGTTDTTGGGLSHSTHTGTTGGVYGASGSQTTTGYGSAQNTTEPHNVSSMLLPLLQTSSTDNTFLVQAPQQA
jgi:hypothetical protein